MIPMMRVRMMVALSVSVQGGRLLCRIWKIFRRCFDRNGPGTLNQNCIDGSTKPTFHGRSETQGPSFAGIRGLRQNIPKTIAWSPTLTTPNCLGDILASELSVSQSIIRPFWTPSSTSSTGRSTAALARMKQAVLINCCPSILSRMKTILRIINWRWF